MDKIKKNPKITVITTTWNREKYIKRVWEALNHQTFKDFEWIVADDGSTDNTLELVRSFKKISVFEIFILSANVHIGKTRMDNEAIRKANGDFIIWNDSDDYFVPEALQLLINKWEEIELEKRENYSGVLAYCKNENNQIINTIEKEIIKEVSLNDAREKYKLKGDLVHFTKSKLLKENLFPEVDLVIPEGVVWTKIGKLKIKIIKEPLMIKEYKVENSISFNGKMKYNKGMAYAKAIIENNLKNYHFEKKEKIKNIINYIRYAIHGEMSIKEILEIWGDNSKSYVLILCLPLSIMLVIKDLLQQKVVKTHREYVESLEKLIITIDK
jgi:glycosyltransferase involved in cell wall biosynthesis